MNKVTGEPVCREGMEMQNREWPCGHSGGRRGWDELRKLGAVITSPVASAFEAEHNKLFPLLSIKHHKRGVPPPLPAIVNTSPAEQSIMQ